MKFVFNYTRVTNRTESIVAGSLIISFTFNHEFVATPGGGGGTPIHYLYGYVPPNGVVILKLPI